MMISSATTIDSWQYEFENEEVNDERWSCLVSAMVESEPDDEECLKILNHHVTTGKIPLVRTICMTDVITLFKPQKEGRKKEEPKIKEKTKINKEDDSLLLIRPTPPPPFPEVVPFLTKYATISDGSCKLSPGLMAYALKYLILCLKEQNYHQRRLDRTIQRQIREKEVKAELLKTFKKDQHEKVILTDGELNESWRRDSFDIFGDPFTDGPFQSPELYIVLYDFYDPYIIPELLKLKVPFLAVTKLSKFRSSSGKLVAVSTLKKLEMINNFWQFLEGQVSEEIALLKYVAPNFDKENSMEKSTAIAAGLTAVLYSIFHLHRLHETYIQQMKVQSMIESLEVLDLTKCIIYNELCDALVTEDPNSEIFVLYSMIEQIVAGVPETKFRVLDYEKQPSSFFEWEEHLIQKELPKMKAVNYPEKPHKNTDTVQRNGRLCLHDDKISLATMAMGSNTLRLNEIFDRFVINSISSKIRKNFRNLSPALKAQNDFNFHQLWQVSKENKDNFRVKLYFYVLMRLNERMKVLDYGFGSELSEEKTTQSTKESTTSSSEVTAQENESRDPYTSDLANLFYKPHPFEKENKKCSSMVTKEIRKVDANSVLENDSSLSSEDAEMVCDISPKLAVSQGSVGHKVHAKKLDQFLESCEISHLSDPNFLSNTPICESFVEKHHFYETFEPNRTVQRLQELFDEYNTAEYTYFPPTDSLFVLGYNDSDFRGVYRSWEHGSIISPLSLRDFIRYVLPEKKKWTAIVNAKYIKFLRGIRMKILDEEKSKDHDVRCGLMKLYKGMTEPERERFLEEYFRDDGSRSDDKKGAKEIETGTQMLALDDLPQKERQRQPDVQFFGINCGGARTQVNVVNYEFHSEDGSTVRVKTQSWLNSEDTVTLTIQRHECHLFVHKWVEDVEIRLMLFREQSGILVTFDSENHPFPLKITQPNGLLIEIDSGASHIKQTYLEPYKWGEDIAKEKSRCCLSDGSVLIFCKDGSIEVLYPSGTKHTCHRFPSGGDSVEIYETFTSTGELWVRDDCSKCKRLGKQMKVMLGVDSETKETYYIREDGTSCMLWPDGKLVTTYPDGTKITTTPKFEEENLFSDTEEEDASLTTTDEQRTIFGEDPPAEACFVVVKCSYLIEHPKFAAVYTIPPKLEVRVLGKMKAEISSKKLLRIECDRSVLKVTPENAQFYSVCRHCEKRSISKIFFGTENLLSKSKDYGGQSFYVYSSGKILYKSDKEVNSEEEEEQGETNPQCTCESHKSCKPKRRCLIIERDLTGMEFLNDYVFHRYQGSLSEDAYYDLGKVSHDKTYIQHSFFNPVYRIGREKYLMKYEEDDGYPTRLTRKNMKDGNASHRTSNSVRFQTKKEIPKVVVARFVRVLLPDPATITNEITRKIAVYLRRSLALSKNYVCQSNKTNHRPIAKYIAKELELIASQLCPSLKLYHHTCSPMPFTEMDIHSIAHRYDMNNYFVESNPVDCAVEIFPRCKRIPKPLKHSGNGEDISEITVNSDEVD